MNAEFDKEIKEALKPYLKIQKITIINYIIILK